MSFSNRITRAEKHEMDVLEWLKRRDLPAFRFGQGLLNPECRDNLKMSKTHVRWMPDIVFFYGKNPVYHGYIDAKTGRLDTDFHSIETAAIKTAEAWVIFSGCDSYFFVWENGETADLETVSEKAFPWSGGNGTGTPYVLFLREHCSAFDNTFGRAPDDCDFSLQPGSTPTELVKACVV